jgi:hypothetical protein
MGKIKEDRSDDISFGSRRILGLDFEVKGHRKMEAAQI